MASICLLIQKYQQLLLPFSVASFLHLTQEVTLCVFLYKFTKKYYMKNIISNHNILTQPIKSQRNKQQQISSFKRFKNICKHCLLVSYTDALSTQGLHHGFKNGETKVTEFDITQYLELLKPLGRELNDSDILNLHEIIHTVMLALVTASSTHCYLAIKFGGSCPSTLYPTLT